MDFGWIQRVVIVIIACEALPRSDDTVKCPSNQNCIPLNQCKTTNSEDFIYPCHRGLNMVCCPNNSNDTNLQSRKTFFFPSDCGVTNGIDKVSGGHKADFGQFPWMALLGYRQLKVNYTQFLCGGSIITDSFVLTAAHCINLNRRLELVSVRVGEHDLLTDLDCYKVQEIEICAEPHVDFSIKEVFIHPEYNDSNLHNDIALIKTRKKIRFTDYVQPVCLPFNRKFGNLTNQRFFVSGWGKTSASNLGGSTILQFAAVKVWNQTTCASNVPPEVQPIATTQLCANGAKKQDACKGDSGGPLVNATTDDLDTVRFFQIGIVSFSSTLTCGNPSLPTVYTRVDKYITWIEETVS